MSDLKKKNQYNKIMRKILVLQHVAHEILGTLNPLLKAAGFRIKYVNFDRDPDATPSMEKYNGLIVLGGYMGVYEAHKYPHLLHEMHVIEQALKKDVPVLGICLGSQLIAHVLGGRVSKGDVPEIGWTPVKLTEEGRKENLFEDFREEEFIFQLHQDTFDLPHSAVHLATSSTYSSQAFKFGEKVFGLQYHLEVDEAMIMRWLRIPANLNLIEKFHDHYAVEKIKQETKAHIQRSLDLSQSCFNRFIELFGEFERVELIGSGHK